MEDDLEPLHHTCIQVWKYDLGKTKEKVKNYITISSTHIFQTRAGPDVQLLLMQILHQNK
jgi:hypothetical protein